MHLPIPKFEAVKNVVVAVTLTMVIASGFVGGFFAWTEIKDNRKQNAILLHNLAKVNKKIELQKIVAEKMTKSSLEVSLATADRIYEMHVLTGIPLHYICGVIEVESMWKPEVKSEVNARGLMQLMENTARPHLAAEKIQSIDMDILFNPVVNVTIGIKELQNLHLMYMNLGVETETDYTFSLNSYFWGSSNVRMLLGKKDSRVNGPNFSYFKRVMDVSKQYKEKGL